MPYSLRVKVKKLVFQGHLTQKEGERIRDALAKQIPKEPYVYNAGWWGMDWKCPTCNYQHVHTIEREKRNYCSVCGQKLDWS
jgi:hypothetical protein